MKTVCRLSAISARASSHAMVCQTECGTRLSVMTELAVDDIWL